MCRSGRDLRVTARCGQCQLGQGGVVVTVDQIMSDARMLRLTREYTIQDLSRLLFPRIGFVLRHHSGGDQHQRIEHSGFVVRTIELMQLFHGVAVSERASTVIDFVVVFVKRFESSDVRALAFRACASRFGLFDCVPTFLQLLRRRRRPERMVLSPRDAPVTHSALWIRYGDFGESVFCFFVFKRVEPRDCTIELFLSLRSTRDFEIYDSEFLRRIMLVRVRHLSSNREDVEAQQEDDQERPFHCCNSLAESAFMQRRFSRKGAKTQSAAVCPRFPLRLCDFAREAFGQSPLVTEMNLIVTNLAAD